MDVQNKFKGVKVFFSGVIVGIVGVLMYFQLYPNMEVVERVEVKYKTITQTKYLTNPHLISVVLPEDTIQIPADTAELIRKYVTIHKAYYSRNIYQDTLRFDTLGCCVLNQQVTQNRLDSIKYSYSLTIPEKTIYTVANQKNNFYISGLLGKDLAAPLLEYSWGKYSVGLGYNFMNSGALVSFKLKLH